MIGQCVYCIHYRPVDDPLMTSCEIRGGMNRTFASSYHECFVGRTQRTTEDGGTWTE